MPKKYSPELRERAVRLVLERQAVEGGPRSRSIRVIAPQVGVGEETLRLWCNRYGPEAEPRPVAESLEEQNKRLKRELRLKLRYPTAESGLKAALLLD